MKKIAVSMLIAGATMLMAEAPACYTACKACHGEKGEKAFAAAPTKVPSKLTKEEIVERLKGYKAGTIESPTAAMMKGQVANLSDKDMEDLANYIAGAHGAPAPAAAESNETK